MKIVIEVLDYHDFLKTLTNLFCPQTTQVELVAPQPKSESTPSSVGAATVTESPAPKRGRKPKAGSDSQAVAPVVAADTETPLTTAVETKVKTISLDEVKAAILALPNGRALAAAALKKMGKEKIIDLAPEQLSSFLVDIGCK